MPKLIRNSYNNRTPSYQHHHNSPYDLTSSNITSTFGCSNEGRQQQQPITSGKNSCGISMLQFYSPKSVSSSYSTFEQQQQQYMVHSQSMQQRKVSEEDVRCNAATSITSSSCENDTSMSSSSSLLRRRKPSVCLSELVVASTTSSGNHHTSIPNHPTQLQSSLLQQQQEQYKHQHQHQQRSSVVISPSSSQQTTSCTTSCTTLKHRLDNDGSSWGHFTGATTSTDTDTTIMDEGFDTNEIHRNCSDHEECDEAFDDYYSMVHGTSFVPIVRTDCCTSQDKVDQYHPYVHHPDEVAEDDEYGFPIDDDEFVSSSSPSASASASFSSATTWTNALLGSNYNHCHRPQNHVHNTKHDDRYLYHPYYNTNFFTKMQQRPRRRRIFSPQRSFMIRNSSDTNCNETREENIVDHQHQPVQLHGFILHYPTTTMTTTLRMMKRQDDHDNTTMMVVQTEQMLQRMGL